MGSRSWLFSGVGLFAAALLSPHCLLKRPHAGDGHLYHLRLPHSGIGLGGVARMVGGLPK